MGGRSRRCFTFPSKTPSYLFECIQVQCYRWTFPQGLLVLFKNTVLYFWVYTGPVLRVDAPVVFVVFFKNTVLCFWVYTSPVLRVDAPTGAFCFPQKHLLIFLSVYKSSVMGGRSRRCLFLCYVYYFVVLCASLFRVVVVHIYIYICLYIYVHTKTVYVLRL